MYLAGCLYTVKQNSQNQLLQYTPQYSLNLFQARVFNHFWRISLCIDMGHCNTASERSSTRGTRRSAGATQHPLVGTPAILVSNQTEIRGYSDNGHDCSVQCL